jgi:hypothetical protein
MFGAKNYSKPLTKIEIEPEDEEQPGRDQPARELAQK